MCCNVSTIQAHEWMNDAHVYEMLVQGSSNDKRKIDNSKTNYALTLKFLPELLLIKNSSPYKFHNFWSTATLDMS